jgi:hypothetical protein
MNERKNIFLKAGIAIVLAFMLTAGVSVAQQTQADITPVDQSKINQEIIPSQDPGTSFYQCMIICGVPYVIIVAALAFAGDGMSAAQALTLAGATAAMIACVIVCLGSGGGSSVSECPCHSYSYEDEIK